MSGSIHIHGTGSSIVDTVLVCRTTGKTRRRWLFEDAAGLAEVVAADLDLLGRAGRVPTVGDTRCIVFGHLTRMGVWTLRHGWDPGLPMRDKLARFAQGVCALVDVDEVIKLLAACRVAEGLTASYGPIPSDVQELGDAVPF